MSTSLRKRRAMFVLTFFVEWRIKPNEVALSVPAWLLCYMRHVFQLVAEVAMSQCVLVCLYCIVEYMFVG